MNATSFETRFLQSAALGLKCYPAISETGELIASSGGKITGENGEELPAPPTFIETKDYPAIKQMKLMAFGAGVLLSGMAALTWSMFTANSRWIAKNDRYNSAYRAGRASR